MKNLQNNIAHARHNKAHNKYKNTQNYLLTNGSGVAHVILREIFLHLAHKVRTHIRSLVKEAEREEERGKV